ncbi:MAG: Pycsar system effector family protein [Myxococcota bacterium]
MDDELKAEKSKNGGTGKDETKKNKKKKSPETKTKAKEQKPDAPKQKSKADVTSSTAELLARDKAEKTKQKLLDAKLREELQVDAEELKELKKKLKKAEGFPERGIETWFRLASGNLYTRSQIVDTKANLLITINSLILSVVLTVAYRFLEQNAMFSVAIVPLITSSLISIFYAVQATRPNLIGRFVRRKRLVTAEDIDTGVASLMTFDDFHLMPSREYEKAVDMLLDDRVLLYNSIKRDIHRLGIELHRRYRFIEHSFGAFLFGLTLAAVMFVLLS